ncbi:hypothetical protein LIER_25892 [Lithospermum erythrorhizon]|uniref:Uncharacterized protein n=1 Tax=Lithospermum erythrorhizon TaxID=34254 RepID=A0AAV3R7Z0_LITER
MEFLAAWSKVAMALTMFTPWPFSSAIILRLDNYGIFQDYTRFMVEDHREQTLSITASGYGLIVFEYGEQVIFWS